jgi:DNA phosphorothioation-dependent restriction protein DptH
MNSLSIEVATRVRATLAERLEQLPDARAELRSFFQGPPPPFLDEVFAQLLDAPIQATARNGNRIVLPVLLQCGHSLGGGNPPIGASGRCDDAHLMDLRNSPECRQYLVLVPPGLHQNLSIASASTEFGLSAASNAATSTFETWWADPFLQSLLDRGIFGSGLETAAQNAHALIEAALSALESVDRQGPSRAASWNLVARVYSISARRAQGLSGSTLLSLACGFPPGDPSLSASSSISVLDRVAEELSGGFRSGIERLKQNALDEQDRFALDGLLAHLEHRCDLLTAFERAPSSFYGPCIDGELCEPPDWWRHLSLDKWAELLDGGDVDEKSGLSIAVANSLVPHVKGGCAVVARDVKLTLENDERAGPIRVTVTRVTTRGAPDQHWERDVAHSDEIVDTGLPSHKNPIRYVASAPGYRPATIKAVSLETWIPGVYATSRTAVKITPTRSAKANKEKVAFEAFLDVTGAGRHYIDLLVSPTVSVEPRVTGRDASGEEVLEDNLEATVDVASDIQHGFELELPGDCYLDVKLKRSGVKTAEILRIYVTCADISPASCTSEFEKAIALNTDERKARHEVVVNRHVRSANLQAWVLDPANVALSYMPVVFAEDYAEKWSPPSWAGRMGPIFSRGAFLHDPRPAPSEFSPPADFVRLRASIAQKIRGDDGNGMVEAAALGEWMQRDISFSDQIEAYLKQYVAWVGSDPSVALWCDVAIVTSTTGDSMTLDQEPDAILLSPLHPLRLAWHCAAQQVLLDAIRQQAACPAASILDPDCVPDSLCLPIRSADGGVVYKPFISVETDSDYWGVLWNGTRLATLDSRSQRDPFGPEMGVCVGGISSGFSSAQVVRALDDTINMFSAKTRLGVLVASSPSNSDACTEGIVQWAKGRWATGNERLGGYALGPSMLDVFDTRARPDVLPSDTLISNLTEDTDGAVRWFDRKPRKAIPDIGIIAQLECSSPTLDERNELKSPLSAGGLIRHRVRRQLPGGGAAFLSETRQSKVTRVDAASFLGTVAQAVATLESVGDRQVGYHFAPSVNSIRRVLGEQQALLVAVSSSTVDPACFLGPWLDGAYLWDYDLPSFSRRAGDTNGYYLISKLQDAEREGLRKALGRLPGAGEIGDERLRETLLEISRRGIPTVRGISRGDTSGTGDLGLFVASRLVQDEFRSTQAVRSLLPIYKPEADGATLALVVPVDPFRGYLDDLARALKRKDSSLSRPDLLVFGIRIDGASVRVKLTPIEVKCRQTTAMTDQGCHEALRQAKALSELLSSLRERGSSLGLTVWQLAFQHLLLSMIAFGMRVYSQRIAATTLSRDWSKYHETVAASILSGDVALSIDDRGRLVVIDKSAASAPRDVDKDGFAETIVLSMEDASTIVSGDPRELYQFVSQHVLDWGLLPGEGLHAGAVAGARSRSLADMSSIEPASSDVVTPFDASAVEQLSKSPPAPTRASDDVADVAPKQTPDSAIENSPADVEQGIVFELGVQAGGFRPATLSLNISDTRLNQLNMGVVGDLGTGKTQLLKSILYQMVRTRGNAGVKPRVLIFDYKKDYSSPDFVQAVGARVVQPQHLPINIFDTSGIGESLTPWLDRFSFFADVLDKIYSGIGPVQRSNLKQAVRRAYDAASDQNRQPTIYDVHAEYMNALGGKADSPLSIIEDLVDRQVFARLPGNAASFGRFFDGVVVISLNSLGQDDKAKNMIVAAMLNMFYEHMLTVPKRPFRGTDPQLRVIDSFLLVDEADNIMKYEFDVLRKILLQGREFGVGVILASQYLKHFKVNATDYREPLLTWFIHKVPNVTPQELSALGLTSDTAELAARVKTLPNHYCLYKSAEVAGEVIKGLPFYQMLARE